MKVHRSALKHGISSEDAVQAAEWSLWIEPLDEDGPPHRELGLGFDTPPAGDGGTRPRENGDETVIHATPARKKYLDLLPS